MLISQNMGAMSTVREHRDGELAATQGYRCAAIDRAQLMLVWVRLARC